MICSWVGVNVKEREGKVDCRVSDLSTRQDGVPTYRMGMINI